MRLFLLLAPLLALVSAANAESFSLPIWKEQALEQGYTLPKPFGLSVSYMGLEQGINVESIAIKGFGGLDKLLEMEAEQGHQATEVLTLRGDLWLFPFLNFYGVVSKIRGYSQTDVTLNINLPFVPPQKIDNFHLDLDGVSTGVGIVLAGGYQQWFTLVDASYTRTNLTLINGSIDAIVVSPRFGYNFTQQGIPLKLWLGAMYQNVEQQLAGSLVDLGLNANIGQLLPANSGFEVKQSLVSKWNAILGAQYEINANWNLLSEIGLGERKSLFIAFERRF